MADRKLIEEYKLSEAINRFKQINEYTFITSAPLTEEGDDDTNVPQSPDNVNNDAQQNDVMSGNQQPMDGGTAQQQPLQQSTDAAPMQMQAPSEQPITMDNSDFANGQQPPLEGGDMSQPMDTDIDNMQPDDEVIDVDDLTDAQKETEDKVDGVSTQLVRLLKVVSKYNDAIDRQNQEIEDLRKEFEKRNPSEEEMLNIRSQAGYPYSEQPKDYWKNKVKENPNYNVMFDNDVPTDKEQEKFEIKDSDLNGLNYKNISDSFDDDDMKLTDFLKF